MARSTLTENERRSHTDKLQERHIEGDVGGTKTSGLRVRFLDEEGKTERLMSTDEVDHSFARVKKIHILKNRSSSATSVLLRNPSLVKRRLSVDGHLNGHADTLNNNSLDDNLNNGRLVPDKTEHTKDETHTGQYKKNCNVYSVNRAKTIASEKKRSTPLSSIPKLIGHRHSEGAVKSTLPAEVDSSSDGGKDFTSRAIGRLSRGLGKLLRRTNSVRISEPDSSFKVAYLGNVLTGWARGDSCTEKPLATLWRNYQQSTKPDVVMKLSITNSGLKGFTKEHGLTEYWSHRITYCASPPHYPKLFCWVYRHEGKKLKHELRCHAVLCAKEVTSKKITEELQVKLRQALVEFKKDRISKQNARLSLANSVYDNPSMPRRKILLSVGATNYRPPLERSKSAPKLGAIEELCSEEDEEEAEMNARQNFSDTWARSSLSEKETLEEFYSMRMLDRRRAENDSLRKLPRPSDAIARSLSDSGRSDVSLSDELLHLLVAESKKRQQINDQETSHDRSEMAFHTLESIAESSELTERSIAHKSVHMLSQGNYLVTDSDDGSVSSGCETASSATSSDAEPASLLSQCTHDDISPIKEEGAAEETLAGERVSLVPLGEKNAFQRRSTYPPLKSDASLMIEFGTKLESLMDNLTDVESLNSSTETEVYQNAGDNDSACSDESGYSELLDVGKDSIIGSTIMV